MISHKFTALCAMTIMVAGAAQAQNSTVSLADFEKGTAKASFIDRWEESPFNHGEPVVQPQVVANPFVDDSNPSSKVLHHRRPYVAGDRNGVVLELDRTFLVAPQPTYLHLMVHNPSAARVIVEGIDRDSEVSQFTGISAMGEPNEWTDAVIEMRGNYYPINKIIIYPDAETAVCRLTGDTDVYIDDIVVSDSPVPRTAPVELMAVEETSADAPAVKKEKKERVTLSAVPSIPGAATFTLSPAPDADGKYKGGTDVEITCNPAPGYRFVMWYKGDEPFGDTMRANNPLPVSWLDEDLVLTMKVEKIP